MEKDDILIWSRDYLLDWGDFKAESNPSAYEDSFSKITYHHSWTLDSEISDGTIYFIISNIRLTTQFLRHLSWVRKPNSSQNLLNHEQGHFDLAELLRPKFEEELTNKFKNLKFPTHGQNNEQRKQFARESSGLMISEELEKCNKALFDDRTNYDKETSFGRNLDIQKIFDEKFQTLRAKPSNY